jgi:hypothetical protein
LSGFPLNQNTAIPQTCLSHLPSSVISKKFKTRQAEQAAEKVVYFVIPSEARNLSLIKTQEKRDSSARSVPRNDKSLSFSAVCEAFPT